MKPPSSIVHIIPPDEEEAGDTNNDDRTQDRNSQCVNDALSLSSFTGTNSRRTVVSQPPRALNGLIHRIEAAIQDVQNIRTSERTVVATGPVRGNTNNNNTNRSEEQALEESKFLNSFVKFVSRPKILGRSHLDPEQEGILFRTQGDSDRQYSATTIGCQKTRSHEYKRKVSDTCQTDTQSANECNSERRNNALDDDQSTSSTINELTIDIITNTDATQKHTPSKSYSVTESSIVKSSPDDLTIVSTASISDQENSNNSRSQALSDGTTDTTDDHEIKVYPRQNDT